MENLNATNNFDFSAGNFSIADLLNSAKGKQMPTEEKAIKIFAYVIAIIISFFGNLSLIVVILSTKSLRTKFNFYIIMLKFPALKSKLFVAFKFSIFCLLLFCFVSLYTNYYY
jgi:hypothetical protein